MNPILQQALEEVTVRGIALKRVIEVSAKLRVGRGREINALGKVRGLEEGYDYLKAKVLASEDGTALRPPYDVRIVFDKDRVLTHSCTCPDHGNSGACKHVIATAMNWAEKIGRPVYRALKNA